MITFTITITKKSQLK